MRKLTPEEREASDERKRAYCRRWYAANREKHIASSKRRYAENPDRAKERTKIWRAANRQKADEYGRRYRLKKEFGITPEEYDEMVATQDGVCAICGEECATGMRLAVDHDHDTKRVRGLLCFKCNRGVGQFRDNPALLIAASSYLVRTTFLI